MDAQENPLALVELFKLYEVVKFVSMTNHMWSGFNQLAHLPTWQRVPDDIKTVIDRNVTRYVRLQRLDQQRMNSTLRAGHERRGLVFNDVDPAPFRRQLAAFYAKWKGDPGNPVLVAARGVERNRSRSRQRAAGSWQCTLLAPTG